MDWCLTASEHALLDALRKLSPRHLYRARFFSSFGKPGRVRVTLHEAKAFAQSVFNIDLDVGYGSVDHAPGVANPFSAVWPSIDFIK